MRLRILIIFLLSAFVNGFLFSQNNDFGIWYGLNTEYSINKKVEIDVSAMIRTYNDASKIEQEFLEGGLTYKYNKFFAIAGSYRLTNFYEDDKQFHIRHKFLADAKGTLPVNRFSFSARLRLQLQARTFFEEGDPRTPDYTGRLKLKGIYNIPKFPINPYFSIETFTAMFENSDRLIEKERIAAGFEYKIIKKHSVEVEYLFERDFLPHISDMNILSLSYNVKF